MTYKVAIIADDLTGALDTSVPFTLHGFSVAVAVAPAGLEQALAKRADVIVVNTASRALTGPAARFSVREVAQALAAVKPLWVLKKIDSRLKGNVGAEVGAVSRALGRQQILVAPAVPDQGRITRDGAVCGAGLDVPLPIAPAVAALGGVHIPANVTSDADLDRLVDGLDPESLLVGARGLGAALARRLSERRVTPTRFAPDRAMLLAFGSRDPATAAQIGYLAARWPGVPVIEVPYGELATPVPEGLPLVLRCTGALIADPGAVAARFARIVVGALKSSRPQTLVLGGGDTALAVLSAMGAAVVEPIGEAAPGAPWFSLSDSSGRGVRCLIKSGGFGTVGVLAELLGPAQIQRPAI